MRRYKAGFLGRWGLCAVLLCAACGSGTAHTAQDAHTSSDAALYDGQLLVERVSDDPLERIIGKGIKMTLTSFNRQHIR